MDTLAKIVLLTCMSASAPITSGVSGIVHVSPSRPGPARIGEPDSAPMAGVKVLARDASHSVVGRATTGADGRFSIALPAGEYWFGIDTGGAALPRCGEAHAIVRGGEVASVELDCDSGMR